MASPNRFLRSILSTLTVGAALFVGSVPATAEATPSEFLTSALERVAAEFGDGLGHIIDRNDAGEVFFVAVAQRGEFVLYTAGEPVGYDDRLAICQSGRAGLSSCEPAPADYECGVDQWGSYCICHGGAECAAMFFVMCTEDGDHSCQDDSCWCDA